MGDHYDYDSITALGRELRRPIQTLLALAADNDPFFAGRGSRREWAEWFGGIWKQFEFGPGTHLRRVHYILVSHAVPVSMPNGDPYLNTKNCWSDLIAASRDARYLGFVPVEDFVDRRNDEVIDHSVIAEADAAMGVTDPDLISDAFSPSLDPDLPRPPRFQFAPAEIEQRFHVELWAEKTTMNDVLISLAREYGLNVVTSSGEISVTHCYQLVKRAEQIEKPVRILYVSDFDPAGLSIPVACARKIEFFVRRDDLDVDIQVRPIVLTHDQCIEYRLPRTPIKETEARAGAFEERYGEGATELDALEAIHPGVLRRILAEEINRYRDGDLESRITECAYDFRQELVSVHSDIMERHADETEEIERAYRDLVRAANAELAPIKKRYAKSLKKIAERFNDLQQTIADELGGEAPDERRKNGNGRFRQ